MWLFYLFGGVLLWQGITSLRGGLRYYRFVRDRLAESREYPTLQPFASVIAPCRGLDQGFDENVNALFTQRYPAYEVVFVSDSSRDPGLSRVRRLYGDRPSASNVQCKFVVAGVASDCGQKVHNLRAAVREVSTESEALVFVDSDARPGQNWLKSLVAPLRDDSVGAATGYRWFLPRKGGLASQLLSVWNASVASALGSDGHRNFCWGGSTAIRKSTFDRLGVLEKWKCVLSDDFALTTVLQTAKLPVIFVPGCLIASFQDCTLRELLEFTTRQMKITRVYARRRWLAVLIGSTLFVTVFFGGIGVAATRVSQGLGAFPPLAILVLIFVLGASKALVRWRAVKIALSEYEDELRTELAPQLLLWPFAAALFFYNSVVAMFSRRIKWRGITYKLKSPTETVIIHSD